MFFDAFTRIGPRANAHHAQPWTLEHVVAEMRHCSISGALVASTMCVQYDPMLENRRLSVQLQAFDHLFPIWNVLPHWTDECPAPDALLREMEAARVRAVTLYPRTNGWELCSPFSQPLLEALQSSRTLVIINYGSEIDGAGVRQLVERYHELPVLLVGLHWGQQRFIMPLLLHHNNLYVAFDNFQINRGLEWLVAHGCEDQLIYASNAADMSMGAHRAYIDYADVPTAVKQKIASVNLMRLLKGQAPPREMVNPDEDALMAAARAGQPLPVPVFDIHAHMLNEGLNGAGGSYVMFDGGPRGMIAMAERMGVDGIGIMSWNGTVGVDADHGNECVTAALDTAPPTWWGLATFDVSHDTPEEIRAKMEVIYADPRFLGIKPYPTYGKHYDDPAYAPIWEFGNEHGLYAMLHLNRYDFSEIDALCPRYSNITFLAAHCGASYPTADMAIACAKRHKNFLIEITLTPVCMGIIDYLVHGAGADRVVYGSDQPMRDPRQQLGWVVFSRLPVEDKIKVLGGNTQELLKRVKATQKKAM